MSKVSYTKRKKVYERDNFTCRYCGLKATKIKDERSPYSFRMVISISSENPDQIFSFEVDHKKPRKLGGSNHIANLLTACWKCNNSKRDKTYKDFVKNQHG